MEAARSPKVELHVHLEGGWDGAHLYDMARKHVDLLPVSVDVGGKAVALRQSVKDAASARSFLKQYVHLPPTTCTLASFLAPFGWVQAIIKAAIRAEGLGALEEFALHFVKRQHESNVIYTEVRWCPHLILEEAVLTSEERYAEARAVVAAFTRGLRRGEAVYGIELRQIIALVDFMPQWSPDLARLMIEVGRESGIVAIDVAGGEAHFAKQLSENPILQDLPQSFRPVGSLSSADPLDLVIHVLCHIRGT